MMINRVQEDIRHIQTQRFRCLLAPHTTHGPEMSTLSRKEVGDIFCVRCWQRQSLCSLPGKEPGPSYDSCHDVIVRHEQNRCRFPESKKVCSRAV